VAYALNSVSRNIKCEMDLGESNLTGSVPSLDFLYRADALKETLKEASIPPQKCPTLPHVRAKYAQWDILNFGRTYFERN